VAGWSFYFRSPVLGAIPRAREDILDWILVQVEALCTEGLADSVPSQDVIGKQADELIN